MIIPVFTQVTQITQISFRFKACSEAASIPPGNVRLPVEGRHARKLLRVHPAQPRARGDQQRGGQAAQNREKSSQHSQDSSSGLYLFTYRPGKGRAPRLFYGVENTVRFSLTRGG